MKSFKKNESKLKFSTLLTLCLLSNARVGIYVCLKCLVNLSLYLYLCRLYDCVWICLYRSMPINGLCPFFIEQHKKHHSKKEWGLLYKNLQYIFTRIKSLAPPSPDYKYYYKPHCLSNNIYKWMLSAFMLDFRWLLSTSVFAANDTLKCSGSWIWKIT